MPRVSNIDESESYKSENERKIEQDMQKTLTSCEKLYEKYVDKSSQFDVLYSTQFLNFEEEIYNRRDKLKALIDKIVQEKIEKLNLSKKNYQKQKFLREPFKSSDNFQNFVSKFKSPTLNCLNTAQLQSELNSGIKTLQTKLSELDEWKVDLENYFLTDFVCRKSDLKKMLGSLKFKLKLTVESPTITTDDGDLTSSSNFNECRKTMRGIEPIPYFSETCFGNGAELLDSRLSLPTNETLELCERIDSEFVQEIKRPRDNFCKIQKETLEKTFNNRTQYPSNKLIDKLAIKLGLKPLQISSWFANKRAIIKRENPAELKKVNKRKIRLTSDQREHLNDVSKICKYPNIGKIAKTLGLPRIVIHRWFGSKQIRDQIKKNAKCYKKEPE